VVNGIRWLLMGELYIWYSKEGPLPHPNGPARIYCSRQGPHSTLRDTCRVGTARKHSCRNLIRLWTIAVHTETQSPPLKWSVLSHKSEAHRAVRFRLPTAFWVCKKGEKHINTRIYSATLLMLHYSSQTWMLTKSSNRRLETAHHL